jgi:hypothetical protein
LRCDNLAAEFAYSVFQASEHPAHPTFVLCRAYSATPCILVDKSLFSEKQIGCGWMRISRTMSHVGGNLLTGL